MSRFSLYRTLMNLRAQDTRRDRRRGHRVHGTRFTPRLEGMEARTLLSTYTVTSNADDGAGTLRDGLVHSTANTINFAPSVFGQTIQLASDELLITRNIKILGPGAAQLTLTGSFLAADVHHRIFDIASGLKVTISGLTLIDGVADNFAPHGAKGGAIYDDGGGVLNLSNDVLAGNEALGFSFSFPDSGPQTDGLGGTVYIAGSRLTVDRSTFTNNIADGGFNFDGAGGAIDLEDGSMVTVDYSTFDRNQALGGAGGDGSAGSAGGAGGFSFGGAIASGSATLIVSHCQFTRNEVKGGNGGKGGAGKSGGDGGVGIGGAISATVLDSPAPVPPTTQIDHCDFVGNHATGGAGGAGGSGGNGGESGRGDGGAINNIFGTMKVSNSSVVQNQTQGGAGGALGAAPAPSAAPAAFPGPAVSPTSEAGPPPSPAR